MTWTKFMDMHSGGGSKLGVEYIFIEAKDEEEAREIFYSRFSRDPDNVTCECCGADFSVSTEATLAQASGYERGCAYDEERDAWVETPADGSTRVVPVEELASSPAVLVIRRDENAPLT